MPKPSQKAPAPFSLRLTPEERRRLEVQAAGQPLGAFIRERLLGGNADMVPVRRTRGRFPVKDHRALGQLLARLGESSLASNVNRLARAANSGFLPVTPDTEEALRSAAADIRVMKRLLMDALGIREQ